MFALREHIAVVLSVLKRMFIASRLTSSDRLKQPVFASVSTLVRELATDMSLSPLWRRQTPVPRHGGGDTMITTWCRNIDVLRDDSRQSQVSHPAQSREPAPPPTALSCGLPRWLWVSDEEAVPRSQPISDDLPFAP